MSRFPRIAQRLFNAPLAIMPHKADMIVAALADRLGIARINGVAPQPMMWGPGDDDGHGSWEESPEQRAVRLRGYDMAGAVAVIPVDGTLVHKLGAARPYCGMTGYDTIRAALHNALDDDLVQAIAFDIDSPGGEVCGCFDLADAIFAMRGRKPMVSILSEMACSAAYAIASATDSITVPRTGYAGSIGVIAVHADLSRMLDKEGITVTIIRHGAQKAEGNEYEPLSDPARGRLQADIDETGRLFIETVARNRGMAADAVAALEAAAFSGPEALRLGLVDAVMAPDDAMAELLLALTPSTEPASP